MRKLIIIVSVLFVAVSCDIIGEGANHRDSRMKDESVGLVSAYLLSPAVMLDYLLLADRFIQAPEEEKDSSLYDRVRQTLYKGDGDTWLIENLGTLDTGGGSLHEPGVIWKVEFKDGYGYYGYYSSSFLHAPGLDGWSFECVSDNLWSAVASDENVTAFQFDGDETFLVSTFGERKTPDGYDCSFKTEGEFKLVLKYVDEEERWWISGRFFHSVGRGSNVYDSCEAVYSGYSNPSFNLVK